MSIGKACPICGEGELTQKIELIPVEHRGQRGNIQHHFSVCGACGSEQADSVALRANKRAMVAFKKQVDGLLTGEEVRVIRARLGISQADAAKIFGGGPVAFSKYEADDVAQSEAMDKLIRLADALPEALDMLCSRVGYTRAGKPEWASGP